MKKITFLLFLAYLTTYSETLDIKEFKITNTENIITPGQTIFYDFVIEGNYGYDEIELSVYYKEINTTNRIAYSRWNREGDNYLNFLTPTTKHWYTATNFNYSENIELSNQKFFLVAKFGTQVKTLTYTSLPDVRLFHVSTDYKNFEKGGRIDYSFEIKGNYNREEIKLKLYYDKVSPENQIAYSRWNREGDSELNFSDYEVIKWWTFTYDKPEISFIGKKFYLEVSFNEHTKILKSDYHPPIYQTFKYCGENKNEAMTNFCANNPGYIIEANFQTPNGFGGLSKGNLIKANIEGSVKYYKVLDSDADKRASISFGYSDIIDSWMPFSVCDNTVPTPTPPNNKESDLKFNTNTNGSRVTSDASSSSLTATHRLDHSNSMLSFNFIVDNIGDASSGSTKIEFYRSSNATFNQSDDAKLSPEISIPSISAGNSGGYYSKTLFASDFEYGLSGNWYIIARIKAEDKNTSNNTVAIKVYFNPSRSSFSTTAEKITDSQKNLKIYNFSGVQIIDKTIRSEQEEWETVKSLQAGLYIVRSGDNTYKVKN